MFKTKSAIALIACTLWAPPALADTKVLKSERKSFAACLATITLTATRLGHAPINIVETTSLRVVRFLTNDGSGQSMLVTCTRLGGDERMVVILSQ